MSERARRLVFRKWDIVPYQDESTFRFFGRMVDRVGEISLAAFKFLHNVDDTSTVSEEMLEVLLRHPFPEETKEHLRSSSIRWLPRGKGRSEAFVTIRGETLTKLDFQPGIRRWCRACLEEKHYGRIWFDLKAIQECPYHGIALTDKTSRGRRIDWNEPTYRLAVDDFGRTKLGIPRELRHGTFAHYVLARLKCEDPYAVPLLDKAKLAHVIDACETIGTLLSRPWKNRGPGGARPGEAELGFQTLVRGRGHLATVCRDWMLAHAPEDRKKVFSVEVFTWAYARSSAACGPYLGKLIREALHAAVASAAVGSDAPIADDEVRGQRITVYDAAKDIGMLASTVSSVAKELGLLEDTVNRRACLTTYKVRKLKAFFAGLVNRDEFEDGLGLDRGTYREIMNSGLVSYYPGRWKGQRGPWFRRDDINRLLETLRGLPQTGRREHSTTLRFMSRHSGRSPGHTAVALLKGKYKVAAIEDPTAGFNGVLIDIDRKRKKLPHRIGDDTIKAGEIAKILGITKVTTRAVLAMGRFETVGKIGVWDVYRRSDVEAFAEKYVSLSVIRSSLNMSHWAFTAKMRGAGVVPLIASNPPDVLDTIYSREEVVSALGYRSDPSVISSPRLDAAWAKLIERAKVRFPQLRLPLTMNRREVWGGSTYKERVVRFSWNGHTAILRADVAPLGEKVGFNFNLTRDRGSTRFDKLLDLLASRNEVLKATRSGETVERRRRKGDRRTKRYWEQKASGASGG